jgi:pyruvate-formate lyase-activating enzyme
VAEYFRLCHEEGLHTALDTSGAIITDKVLNVLDNTDLVLLDIKTMDAELYPRLTGVNQNNNLAFLDILEERGINTWIRHVVVPEITDNDKWLHKLGNHVAHYNCVEKIEILQIYGNYRLSNRIKKKVDIEHQKKKQNEKNKRHREKQKALSLQRRNEFLAELAKRKDS